MSNIYSTHEVVPIHIDDFDHLQPHTLAQEYPLLDGDEARALETDISENGLRLPIVVYEGQILDGRNRYAALLKLRAANVFLEPHFVQYTGDDPKAFVQSVNLHRRHLTLEYRMNQIKNYLLRHPEYSNRRIANTLNVSKDTIRRTRSRLDSGGASDPPEKRTGSDGKEYPAKHGEIVQLKSKRHGRTEHQLAKELIDGLGYGTASEFAKLVLELGGKARKVSEEILKLAPTPPPTITGRDSISFSIPPTNTPLLTPSCNRS